MNKIKVLHIIETFGIGGRERVVIDLCNLLDKNKYDVAILVLSNTKMDSMQFVNRDVRVYSLEYADSRIRGIASAAFWITGLGKLVSLFNLIKPQIVHTHLFYSHLLHVSLAIRFSKEKILHFRTVHTSGLFYENQTKLFNKVRLLVEKYAISINKTYIIGISNTIHKNNIKYFKHCAEEIRYIPNGIDLEKYHASRYYNIKKSDFGMCDESVIVSYVARLDYGKNHDMLIDIWDQVLKNVPTAKLYCAGDGILRTKLKNKVKELHLENSIYFLGNIGNISELLSISNLCVFPSSFEGFSLVMLEKLAMGLPVVASDIDAFKELIVNHENGILVPLGNEELYISEITKLCLDNELNAKIAGNAEKTAQGFSVEQMVKRLEDYYDKLR